MIFGRLKSGNLIYAPHIILVKETLVVNPTEAQLREAGYLSIVKAEPPVCDDKHYPVSDWTEQNGEIVQTWRVEAMEPDPMTKLEERTTSLETQQEDVFLRIEDLELMAADQIGGGI